MSPHPHVSPSLSLFKSFMANLTGYDYIGSGKPEGTSFGSMDLRKIKRKRNRQLIKANSKANKAQRSIKAVQGFA